MILIKTLPTTLELRAKARTETDLIFEKKFGCISKFRQLLSNVDQKREEPKGRILRRRRLLLLLPQKDLLCVPQWRRQPPRDFLVAAVGGRPNNINIARRSDDGCWQRR
jgi:hypothetical protein